MTYDFWSGPYIGLNVGAAVDDSGYSLTPSGCFLAGCGTGGVAANGARSFSGRFDRGGIIGGIQGGYNYRLDPMWVLGVEADFQGLSNSETRYITNALNPPVFAPGSAVSVQARSPRFLGTLRGRVGYNIDPQLLVYATGGLAYAKIDTRSSVTFPPPGSTDTYAASNSTTEIGWTVGGGAEWAIASNWSIKGEYLYVDLDRTRYTDPLTNPGLFPNLPSLPSYATSVGNKEHIIRVGLNYSFNPPPPPVVAPPAPPAPPPAERKVFLVFFDWDRDTITAQGMAIIHQAADAYRSGAPVRVMVTGYTDRSGSPGYNQRLSERRANNVANAMAGMGVPRGQMAVSGRGENDNRVPTADGVREPQNRRVEIVF